MSRDDGFAVADMDSGYFEDAKMRDLWQRLHDPDQMARASCLHAATLLASWRQGERVTVSQACPLWLVTDADLVAALIASKLLDKTERLPKEAFVSWFGVATNRRKTRRELGRLGGLAKAANRASYGVATVKPSYQPSSSPSLPDRPSVPTDRPTDRPTDASAYPDGDKDCLDTYHALSMYRPWGQFSGDKLKGAIGEYGNDVVDRALFAEHALDLDRKTLLDRTLARLARDADRARDAKPKPKPRDNSRTPDQEAAYQDARRRLAAGEII